MSKLRSVHGETATLTFTIPMLPSHDAEELAAALLIARSWVGDMIEQTLQTAELPNLFEEPAWFRDELRISEPWGLPYGEDYAALRRAIERTLRGLWPEEDALLREEVVFNHISKLSAGSPLVFEVDVILVLQAIGGLSVDLAVGVGANFIYEFLARARDAERRGTVPKSGQTRKKVSGRERGAVSLEGEFEFGRIRMRGRYTHGKSTSFDYYQEDF
ncbi:hypothetical protein [Demequina sp. NBRC 110055]|uniref:hypothetical protein n=1 Tax=Demequina sp. NBRC 110055 TaxID=1570344 RepID=UPI000A00D808|nr:hypothetical protein [Demequina sp. NBRC 110055]